MDQQLTLRVLNSSSHESDFPPESVLAANPLSNGWRTTPNASAPHFLTLALTSQAEISSIQFVAHETFTPSTVEVYIQTSQNDGNWQRLGHVRMAENSNGRQRKTFKVKVRANQIRFQMSEILPNPENKFGQVSLTSVLIRGENLTEMRPGSAHMSSFKDKFVPEAVRAQVQANQVYDEIVLKLIQRLGISENEAVASDEYLEAERMSVACKKVQEFGKALDQLEIKKASAVKRKDYRAAQEIKENIDQIKEILQMDFDDMVCTLNGEPLRPKKVVKVVKEQIFKPVNKVVEAGAAPSAVQNDSAGQKIISPKQQQQQIIGSQENEIPETTTNHSEDRPLNQVNQNNQFALTEEEKAEIEAERRKRAEEMKQERLRKAGKLKPKEQSEAAQNDQDTATESTSKPLTKSRNEHFSSNPFQFATAIAQLSDYWENSDQSPSALPQTLQHSDQVQVLRVLNFSEIFIRLSASKSLEHIMDAVNFVKFCIMENPQMYSDSGMAVLEILSLNANLSLLNHGNQVFLMCYVGSLQKCQKERKVEFEAVFDDVEDELAKQKENAVLLGQIGVKPVGALSDAQIMGHFAEITQNASFISDCMKLIGILLPRLTEKQKRTRLQALNIMATLASLPGFPEKQFLQVLISKPSIDKFSNLKTQEQTLQNQKYASIYESRIVSLFAVLQQQPGLISKNSASILLDFLKFSLPNANKKEIKDAVLGCLELFYRADDVFSPQILLNSIQDLIKNEPLKKQIATIFSNSDTSRGGTPRIIYFPEGQKLVLAPQSTSAPAQQNLCQFCLYQCKSSDLKELHRHLLLECPCCGICPGCHQLIEIPCLPDHILHNCQGTKFDIVECPNCMCAVDSSLLPEHQKECKVKLRGEESVCPLCAAVLKDGEDALVHYSDGCCNANPRTSRDLKEVIRQKLEK